MSEARALTNLIGNEVATVVISRWENEVNPQQLKQNLALPCSPATPKPGCRGELTGVAGKQRDM